MVTTRNGLFQPDFKSIVMMNLKRLALFSSVLGDLGRIEQFLRNKNTREACDVPCEYFAELFSDLDDEIKALKAENDLIKEDLTRLTIENVEQNKILQTVEEQSNLLGSQNSVLESSIRTIEARLDILESNSGKG